MNEATALTKDLNLLCQHAKALRREILKMLTESGSGHTGGSLSAADILAALYFYKMRHRPNDPLWRERDRFVLSKGHAAPLLYAALALAGYIDRGLLKTLRSIDSPLQGHPSSKMLRGIEVSTGSLGHGLSVGAGMAFALKKDRKKSKVYVLLSDGELNEGSTWEAVMFASQHKLGDLIAIVDYNKMQAMGSTFDTIDLDPLPDKWLSFGWNVKEVNGHDFNELFKAFGSISSNSNKPTVIIAHTIKGKGVSFMENKLLWHYRPPDENEYRTALRELSK